ncbi:MAG: diguanylate cyclase [Phenylobacterium sp.]|uniref:GGDEF domain-containing protein n=1 Tax=Phenylobacterium sp. TaxID=1871053 RepID=UPI0025F7344E|nr:GGDEF domain-containing protein [Phenylobacterium sp.]MBI1199690.1 diguanylate cyclase [Phenylobacterium sp.]
MKITGARSEPFSAIRRRALVKAGAATSSTAAARVDNAAFLGVTEAEMTPAVQAAILALVSEIEDLRGEVGRLKARLAEAEGLADRDGLTPLLNRRAFLRELGRVRTFAQRYGAPASLVYFDLDGFKAINDRYGHAAGDAALQAVAERLAGNVRESDILGRLGGDEFALVLVQADASTAQAKAAALAEVVEREPIRFGEWTAPVRLSWGVTEIAPDVETEALVAQADAAMFAAKRMRKAG